jgi:hypothetical protein
MSKHCVEGTGLEKDGLFYFPGADRQMRKETRKVSWGQIKKNTQLT